MHHALTIFFPFCLAYYQYILILASKQLVCQSLSHHLLMKKSKDRLELYIWFPSHLFIRGPVHDISNSPSISKGRNPSTNFRLVAQSISVFLKMENTNQKRRAYYISNMVIHAITNRKHRTSCFGSLFMLHNCIFKWPQHRHFVITNYWSIYGIVFTSCFCIFLNHFIFKYLWAYQCSFLTHNTLLSFWLWKAVYWLDCSCHMTKGILAEASQGPMRLSSSKDSMQ